MKALNLDEWQSLCEVDTTAWRQTVHNNLSDCIRITDTRVFSATIPESIESAIEKTAPLAGLPYAVKDLFDTRGHPTHASSILPPLLKHRPSSDAQIVQHMQSLGASCVAKTQMNEFAYGLSGENAHYGDCPHPRIQHCLSGGSSSGSAHAVAAGCLPLAFGTDTGGSIRLPSAWCGVYGIRWAPDYFMQGALPLASSFDTMGWFTRTAPEMATVLAAWFQLKTAPTRWQPLRGAALFPEDLVAPETQRALLQFSQKAQLHTNEDLRSLRALLEPCQRAFNVLQSQEAYTLHKDWLEQYGSYYDPVVKERILRGQAWTETEIYAAQHTLERVRDWFKHYFKTHDYLAMPICPGPAIPVQQATPKLREQTLQLTTPASLAGLPALSVPVWIDSERSVGIQFIFNNVDPSVPLALLEVCKNT
ncbi:amidase family protein [Coraliomargarita algicola]|uniref:Amidase family protein n=1 Tax=Coraliomargarita algicola TaxID=3092156 RepID=A0ABZ0RHS7_9BACT|nr:amidase family protein [Coraliomargarita sp. J2-16]WPJ94570.1 amidase family protein [Coraliomargarita sp. J2-16]